MRQQFKFDFKEILSVKIFHYRQLMSCLMLQILIGRVFLDSFDCSQVNTKKKKSVFSEILFIYSSLKQHVLPSSYSSSNKALSP